MILSIFIIIVLYKISYTMCSTKCDTSYYENARKLHGRTIGFLREELVLENEENEVMFLKILSKNMSQLCKKSIPKYINEIDMTKIGLEYIEPGFLDDTNVMLLNLSYNNLKVIQNNIFNQSEKLLILDLRYNEIYSVGSKALNNLKNLQVIYLDNNEIIHWNSNWFENNEKLHHVSMRSNLLYEIPENAFQNLKSEFKISFYEAFLKIYLDDNEIKFLHKTAFRKIRKLSILSLSYNQITELPESLFYRVMFILKLDLSYNKFICFSDSRAMTLFKNVKLLNLRNNLLNSDCINNLKQFYKEKFDIVLL